MSAKEYGQRIGTGKFHTHEGYPVQLRQTKTKNPSHGPVVAVFPEIGGQWASPNGRAQAVRLARKFVRFLNS